MNRPFALLRLARVWALLLGVCGFGLSGLAMAQEGAETPPAEEPSETSDETTESEEGSADETAESDSSEESGEDGSSEPTTDDAESTVDTSEEAGSAETEDSDVETSDTDVESASEPEAEPEYEDDLAPDVESVTETDEEQALPSDPPAPAEGEETIRVTGSRIQRKTFEGPSPVQVIGRRELEASGYSSVAELVRDLAINTGSEFNADAFSQNGSVGTAQFNLRGLGLGATLVLINGRRQTLSATRSDDGQTFVDVNTIPVAAIERVEVLTDGASAIYGSDAVAGVVNLVTRKNFEGLDFLSRFTMSGDGDQTEYLLGATFGAVGDRGRMSGVVTYLDRERLGLGQRSFSRRQQTQLSLAGSPGTYFRTNVNGTIQGVFPDPNCEQGPNSQLTTNASGLPFCGFDFTEYFDLVPREDRVNGFVNAEYDVGGGATVFGELGVTRSRLGRRVSPSFPNLQSPVVPANHVDNPFGEDVVEFGRPLGAERGADRNRIINDTLRTSFGVRGDFGEKSEGTFLEDWQWDTAFTYSANRYTIRARDTLVDNYQDALNDCSDPSDLSGCYSPFFARSPGTNSEDLIDSLIGDFMLQFESSLITVDGDITGTIAKLPGGDMGVAFGGQLRQEKVSFRPDHDFTEQRYAFIVGGDQYRANRTIGAAYGEMVIPPMKGLEFQAAVRFEEYEGFGSTVDPKVSVSYLPWAIADSAPALVEKLRLRGSFGTAFRAPSLLQTRGSLTSLEEFPGPVFRPVVTSGSQDLGPENSRSWTAGMAWELVKRLTVSFDWWNYRYEDIIVRENAQQIVRDDVTQTDPRVIRDPLGGPARVNISFINASDAETNGFDFTVGYRFTMRKLGFDTLDWGMFGIRNRFTFINKYDFTLDGGSGTIDAAGSRNFNNPLRSLPKWRGNLMLDWLKGGHYAAVGVRYIAGYDDDENTDALGNQASIDSWKVLDLQYRYRLDNVIGNSTTFIAGVQNLLGTNPPFVRTNGGYDTKVHDPRGRVVHFELQQSF